jgi:hypothetical protein
LTDNSRGVDRGESPASVVDMRLRQKCTGLLLLLDIGDRPRLAQPA